MSPRQLREAYEIYRSKLSLDAAGQAPSAAAVQYFVTAWRELRRRKNRKNGHEKIAAGQ
jgi:hypothetical protein